MDPSNKLHGLLGMARRAGKLGIGFDAAITAVKHQQSDTLLLAADASPKTVKECRFTAEAHAASVITLPLDKADFSAVIGTHKPVAVAAVLDGGFAKAIRSYCIEMSTKEEPSL